MGMLGIAIKLIVAIPKNQIQLVAVRQQEERLDSKGGKYAINIFRIG